MSDSISRVNDDYDAYVDLCTDLKLQPLPMVREREEVKSFYQHEKELREQHKLYKNYYGEYNLIQK